MINERRKHASVHRQPKLFLYCSLTTSDAQFLKHNIPRQVLLFKIFKVQHQKLPETTLVSSTMYMHDFCMVLWYYVVCKYYTNKWFYPSQHLEHTRLCSRDACSLTSVRQLYYTHTYTHTDRFSGWALPLSAGELCFPPWGSLWNFITCTWCLSILLYTLGQAAAKLFSLVK